MQRFASRIDKDGLLTISIDEVSDTELDKYFEEHPEMKRIAGCPMYYSEKHGYWPRPTNGWKTHD